MLIPKATQKQDSNSKLAFVRKSEVLQYRLPKSAAVREYREGSPSAIPKRCLRRASNWQVCAGIPPQITSSNSRFSDWIPRSISDRFEMMIRGNPERHIHSRSSLVQHGIWAGWNHYRAPTLWLNPKLRKECSSSSPIRWRSSGCGSHAAEPGKILHEMRHSEMAGAG